MNSTERVAEQLIAAMEAGTLPWSKPWRGESFAPKNLVSGKAYKGSNAIILSIAKYKSPWWLTYHQASDLGGHVKRGEKATWIIYAKRYVKAPEKKGDEPETVLVWRDYKVFNLEQTEGVDHDRIDEERPAPPKNLPKPKGVVDRMPDRPRIEHGGGRAAYNMALDIVKVPKQEQFKSPESYYSTLFHELVHSTGHKDRLNRDLKSYYDNPESYGREELVAEVGAAALAHHCGIFKMTRGEQASYLASWLKVLKQDHSFLLGALSAADKACDFILGIKNGWEEK